MTRSTTSSPSAASTSPPPPNTEPHGPGLSSYGLRSAVPQLPRRASSTPPFAIFAQQVDGDGGGLVVLGAVFPDEAVERVLGRLAVRGLVDRVQVLLGLALQGGWQLVEHVR